MVLGLIRWKVPHMLLRHFTLKHFSFLQVFRNTVKSSVTGNPYIRDCCHVVYPPSHLQSGLSFPRPAHVHSLASLTGALLGIWVFHHDLLGGGGGLRAWTFRLSRFLLVAEEKSCSKCSKVFGISLKMLTHLLDICYFCSDQKRSEMGSTLCQVYYIQKY